MRLRLILSLVIAVLMTTALGCSSSSPTGDDLSRPISLAEEVDLTRMMEVVEYLCGEELRGRPAGSPQSLEVEDYLVDKLKGYDLKPMEQLGLGQYRQEFEVPSERCFIPEPTPGLAVTAANIIGMIAGDSEEDMVILTANYDGLGMDPETGQIYPGADYNASGVSAVLEAAAIFSSLEEKPDKTVVFALLGAEECGGYGSQALAEALEAEGFRQSVLIINLEGLGAGDGGYMDIWDLKYSKNKPTVEAVEKSADLLEVVLELGGADPGTSASTFFLYHIPAVTCDWSWFNRTEHPDFHMPSDTPQRLNRDGLLKVTRVVTAATGILALEG